MSRSATESSALCAGGAEGAVGRPAPGYSYSYNNQTKQQFTVGRPAPGGKLKCCQCGKSKDLEVGRWPIVITNQTKTLLQNHPLPVHIMHQSLLHLVKFPKLILATVSRSPRLLQQTNGSLNADFPVLESFPAFVAAVRASLSFVLGLQAVF